MQPSRRPYPSQECESAEILGATITLLYSAGATPHMHRGEGERERGEGQNEREGRKGREEVRAGGSERKRGDRRVNEDGYTYMVYVQCM